MLPQQRTQAPNDHPSFCERKDSPSAGVASVTAQSKSTCTSKWGPSPGERVRGVRPEGDHAVARSQSDRRCTDGAHLFMHYGSSRSRTRLVVDVARLFSDPAVSARSYLYVFSHDKTRVKTTRMF